MNMQTMLGASWKTTGSGSAAIVAGLTLLLNELNGDGLSMPELIEVVGFIASGLVGLFARDKKVSSQQEGIRK